MSLEENLSTDSPQRGLDSNWVPPQSQHRYREILLGRPLEKFPIAFRETFTFSSEIHVTFMRFEVFGAMPVQIGVLEGVTPCSLVHRY